MLGVPNNGCILILIIVSGNALGCLSGELQRIFMEHTFEAIKLKGPLSMNLAGPGSLVRGQQWRCFEALSTVMSPKIRFPLQEACAAYLL